MDSGLIITLPQYDEVTEYFSKFSEEIIELAKSKSIKIKKIQDKEINKNNVEKILTKLKHSLIVFNAHGSSEVICGHQSEPILINGQNEYLLKDRITYARACNAGQTIGKNAVKEGGCFIGYKTPFEFFADPEKYHNPLIDANAQLFLNPSNLVPLSLLKGNTAIQAHEKSKKQMLKNMKKVMISKKKDNILMAASLWNNYVGQVLQGDNEITI